jgi:PleD family two-component response regulator
MTTKMQKTVLILDDSSDTLGELIKKLSAAHVNVKVCFSPEHALQQLEGELPHLLIAAGEFPEMNAYQFAEKAFESKNLPAYVILKSAGDSTQLRMTRHPGIIGIYYRPLKVQKLFDTVMKFLK